MNNLGPTIEKIFGVLLILVGSFIIAIYIMVINDEGEFTGSIISDILTIFTLGFLPLYFGFKLYNGFDILRMKSQSSYTFDSMFTSKEKKEEKERKGQKQDQKKKLSE